MLVVPATVQAQATRTWVSGVGDDVNPCSRTAPCKTFAGAISKTASGGIIDALDPGGYGALTITKPITIEGNGTLASALASGTNGFVINITSGTNRDVVLRNILIDGSGTTLGINGIRFIAGDSLTVENCSIEQFSGQGIDFEPNSLARLIVQGTTITQAGGAGILVKPAAGGIARVSIFDSSIHKNATGVLAQDSSTAASNVSIFRSRVSENTVDGVFAQSTTAASVTIVLDGDEVGHNASIGIRNSGANAFTRVANTLIEGNGTSVSAASGELCTYQNNRVTGGAPGAFTGTCVPSNQ
ncbi:MAG: right-handed parallel beta-helix repeat-containing protein [Acidobacteria bacterium]|nr:right-handed parallel beta-helix repeat-containing protein [Acidobacteriota bacterium]